MAATAAKKGKKKDTQQLRCNPTCLRRRMLEKVPRSRALLESEGWKHYFSRKLLEQGVVTYAVKTMYGCLSPVQSDAWRTRKVRGVTVPKRRLPAGTTL